MKSEQILARPPLVLSQEQREFYFESGYLLLEGFVSRQWLDRLWEVSNEFIERSRGLKQSNTTLALEPTHSAENPRLRRLIDPTEHHPLYWEYVSQGPLADVAEDLLGPAFKFHHSKLNFKWSSGGEERFSTSDSPDFGAPVHGFVRRVLSIVRPEDACSD